MKKTILILFMLLMMVNTVSAEVYTVDSFDKVGETVSVIGNPDMYPIEFFNEAKKQYDGIMPKILNSISEKIGVSFSYVHSDNAIQASAAEDDRAEVVSAYIINSGASYAVDKVKIFSYDIYDKKVSIGLAFTKNADKALVEKIKNVAISVSPEEINGYLVDDIIKNRRNATDVLTIYVVCGILVAVLVALYWFTTRSAKKKLYENRMIDAETDIGNFVYFESRINALVPYFSIGKYYMLYVVIDSNRIQLYHRESAFTDIVKYTASVLSSYEENAGIPARITENGFVLTFESETTQDALKLCEGIVSKLAMYVERDGAEAKSVFHAAMYNLAADDKNCELVLFNLRRNCNKLIGTDTPIIVCDSDMINSVTENKKLMDSICNGFKNNEFKLYLQFIVDNKTKKIVSAESLSRWESAENGIIPPGKYIGVMEENGMISTLDYHMFEMACRQLHKWKDTEFGDITVSCNFTRITLSEEDFIEKITNICRKYVFNISNLIIEITEDAMEKNRETALENVRVCKNMGFKIALDDLGSGYTSLINLCEYPIDIVKLDRDILLNTDNENGRALFAGIIALAHSLNLKVVCEGVEIELQDVLVSSTDCDMIQGWYYSKPSPARDAEEFVRQYTREKIIS